MSDLDATDLPSTLRADMREMFASEWNKRSGVPRLFVRIGRFRMLVWLEDWRINTWRWFR